ncbi:hypothetical protein BCR33DRAFT_714374 [Rhizoclosmatium globosum]|uniref:peptidylprolyl isomerase n=1 Tax=Rhizoclosmatium globosum TaxID=329046 RepID=A0A1Y2CNT3_9FUNG|nr:hypothetical protein BCR33DRAFT_714374 [Rhizoclosmatium globosum]|eukprot:ORY48637.1 hypothetical protein BCR33DRAFT_714374 [Rhizoclosmatium globosum]
MQITAALLFASMALASVNNKVASKELVIDVTHKVAEEDCPYKSQKGDRLSMHYTGKLWIDGKKFDSSRTATSHSTSPWCRPGYKGMGSRTHRYVRWREAYSYYSSILGYGDRGAGGVIPGGAVLVFDVELLKIHGKGGKKDEL